MATADLLRTGPFVNSTARIVSGLVHSFGRLDFVTDNTDAFEGSSFIPGDCVIPVGDVLIYIATIVPDEYPIEVLSDDCSSFVSIVPDEYPTKMLPDGCSSTDYDGFPDVVEVFTASNLPNRHAAAERSAGARDGAGGSNVPVPNWLAEALEGIHTPVTPDENMDTQATDLDAGRQRVLEQAETVAAMKRQVEATVREFNNARGLLANRHNMPS